MNHGRKKSKCLLGELLAPPKEIPPPVVAIKTTNTANVSHSTGRADLCHDDTYQNRVEYWGGRNV